MIDDNPPGNAFREDLFFELSLDLFCIADSHSASILKVNRQWEKTLGYTREALMGRSFMELVHPLFDNMPSGFALHEMIYDENKKAVDYRFLERPSGSWPEGSPMTSTTSSP